MNVWFGTTTHDWPKYKDRYFAIRKFLLDHGCNLLFDWIPDADRFYNTEYKNRNIRGIFDQVVEAIDKAQIVIIEYSIPNFSTSHQINYALLKKKPILVMRTETDNPRFNDSYLDAIQSPYLTLITYRPEEYQEILSEFISSSTIEPGQKRYNIVLGKKHKMYLDWAANQYHTSRSELIKQLIEQKILTDNIFNTQKPKGPTLSEVDP